MNISLAKVILGISVLALAPNSMFGANDGTRTQQGLVYGVADGQQLTMDYYAPKGTSVHPIASRLMPRHLVLFVVIGQPDLNQLAAQRPENIDQMYQVAAAQEVVHGSELLMARLREHGALALETSSGKLSTTLVNSYLEIKQRSQL